MFSWRMVHPCLWTPVLPVAHCFVVCAIFPVPRLFFPHSGTKKRGFLEKGFLQECTPLLWVALWAPRVPLGPICLGSFCSLGRDTAKTPFAKFLVPALIFLTLLFWISLLFRCKECLRWIQKGFTAEPPRNDSGPNFQWNDSGFGPKVRVTGQKSELRAKSQSYSLWQTPKIRTESPRKGTRIGFWCFCRKPPLKPSWIHLRNVLIFWAFFSSLPGRRSSGNFRQFRVISGAQESW